MDAHNDIARLAT